MPLSWLPGFLMNTPFQDATHFQDKGHFGPSLWHTLPELCPLDPVPPRAHPFR